MCVSVGQACESERPLWVRTMLVMLFAPCDGLLSLRPRLGSASPSVRRTTRSPQPLHSSATPLHQLTLTTSPQHHPSPPRPAPTPRVPSVRCVRLLERPPPIKAARFLPHPLVVGLSHRRRLVGWAEGKGEGSASRAGSMTPSLWSRARDWRAGQRGWQRQGPGTAGPRRRRAQWARWR